MNTEDAKKEIENLFGMNDKSEPLNPENEKIMNEKLDEYLSSSVMDKEETIELLRVVVARARWMREEGESDMRSIIFMVDGIITALRQGKSVDQILEEYDDNE